MTDYTVGAIIYVLVIAFLVSVLLIGGLLIVNLGLMSKRPEDHVGGRTPSDVGILQNTAWPESPYQGRALPAEEDADEAAYQAETRPSSSSGRRIVIRENGVVENVIQDEPEKPSRAA